MATMYEMIMDLPLFKGVGKDHVSQFLEKTSIGFRNYSGGEVLADLGEKVRMVRFVISGELNIIHPLDDINLSVEERSGFGRVLGADRLFGMSTTYPYRVVAVGKTSIMEFSKEQYVNLLNSDSIYMLNFFNYLSLRAQRSVDSVMHYCHSSIHDIMCRLVVVMTDPGARGVVINGTDDVLADYCSCSVEEVRDWKQGLVNSGIAECDANCIKILSRHRFLD